MSTLLLRSYIASVLSEVTDFRVPNQLISKRSHKKQETEAEKEKDLEQKEEVDEINVVTNIVGVAGPVGASNGDLKGFCTESKSKKKSSVY